MVKISVTIITFNEAKNIARCIASVKEVADEILVVDSFSTDDTKKICLDLGVKFLENAFQGHIEQKNFALQEAEFDYVLSLDADECLDEQLKKNIIQAKENWIGEGYYFNRLTNYCGQWIRHCGWYPDKKLRLLDRRAGKWGGSNPHDIIEMKEGSKQTYLEGNILHYSYDSISSHIDQTNKFTTIAAKEAFNRGSRSSLLKPTSRGVLKFLRDYFFKRGFLDGRYGLIICSINALSAFLKYAKIKELQNNKAIE
ncbi:MAG: glycosyltransferase involved in cell wall biosynthesis [Bacteriovoracaceae bacterium]|jgi:glycosyltransferase involved in cell wall biosynthesis